MIFICLAPQYKIVISRDVVRNRFEIIHRRFDWKKLQNQPRVQGRWLGLSDLKTREEDEGILPQTTIQSFQNSFLNLRINMCYVSKIKYDMVFGCVSIAKFLRLTAILYKKRANNS